MYSRASQFQMPPPKVDSQTKKQTRQDKTRQVPSRPGPTSTCNCTCACTCIYHSRPVSPSYAMQNSRRFWQSMTWSVSPTSSSSYLRPASMYLVTLCTIPVPDYQASKQAINRFFWLPSIGFYRSRKHVLYVRSRHVCVCVNSCIPVNIPNKHPIRPADRRRTGCFVCWLPGRLG